LLSLWERFRQWRKRDALRAKRFREKHKTLTNAFEIFFYVMVNLALGFSVLMLCVLFTQFEVIMKLGLLALIFAVCFVIGGLLTNAFEIFFYVMVNLALGFLVLMLYVLFTQFEVIMKLGLLTLTFAVWFGIGGLLYFDYRKFIQKRHMWE